jgi:biopolymer transport protein ExbB/TolQ
MSLQLESFLLLALCVITGLLLAAVVGSGYTLSRRITQRSADLELSRQKLAARVSRYQDNQKKLQEIVLKLNGEIKQLKEVVEDQQQSQVDSATRPTQDYERVVSLFAQGKADASVAQAMGLSRGEAELISLMAQRTPPKV